MQLRSDIQVPSMIQAMQKIILPAIDPANQLAMEQAQLMIGMLHLMAHQQPFQFRYDIDELERLVATVDAIASGSDASTIAQQALAELALQRAYAADVLARAKAEPAELLAAIRLLRSALGEVVTAAAADNDAALEAQVSAAVLDLSKQQLLRERSLLKLQAWEANKPELPDIGELLD